eukprot:m.70891 g.70891  ORF g.70891 m.70891 type:complete len:302 (+) comp24282_c0_seq2:203-1108(+)
MLSTSMRILPMYLMVLLLACVCLTHSKHIYIYENTNINETTAPKCGNTTERTLTIFNVGKCTTDSYKGALRSFMVNVDGTTVTMSLYATDSNCSSRDAVTFAMELNQCIAATVAWRTALGEPTTVLSFFATEDDIGTTPLTEIVDCRDDFSGHVNDCRYHTPCNVSELKCLAAEVNGATIYIKSSCENTTHRKRSVTLEPNCGGIEYGPQLTDLSACDCRVDQFGDCYLNNYPGRNYQAGGGCYESGDFIISTPVFYSESTCTTEPDTPQTCTAFTNSEAATVTSSMFGITVVTLATLMWS